MLVFFKKMALLGKNSYWHFQLLPLRAAIVTLKGCKLLK
jgi:hypothetical protein